MFRYFTVRVGSKHCLVKQCNNGPRFWLKNAAGQRAGYYNAKTADVVAQAMQRSGEEDVLLTDEKWEEETTVVQGGAGVPRFKGASA